MIEWISKASVMRIIDSSPVYKDVLYATTYIAEQVENLPVRKEEVRPHGKWIKFILEGGFLSSHKCSNCGFNGNQLWHFCPSCGADMRKEGEAE